MAATSMAKPNRMTNGATVSLWVLIYLFAEHIRIGRTTTRHQRIADAQHHKADYHQDVILTLEGETGSVFFVCHGKGIQV
jgi:hypothetical protein